MMYGMDFGFSVDPAAMVELCFLDEHTIYIHNEVYKTGLLPNDYIQTIEKEFGLSAKKAHWFADCARPDSIAQLRFDGLRIEGAPKGKGSIESGIEYLKSKKIIIHPRCTNMVYEAYNYKYKIDKNSGNITTDIVDACNHCLVGETLIDTENGPTRIDEIVGKEGKTWSYNEETKQKELNNFFDVRMTQENVEIYEIELEDGRTIKGTANHPVLTQRGWINIEFIENDDTILSIENYQ